MERKDGRGRRPPTHGWSQDKQLALELWFQGELSTEDIAQRCNVKRRQLYNWIKSDEFQTRLEKLRGKLVDNVKYADKVKRIVALNDLAERARSEFMERPKVREVRQGPGGTSTVTERFNRDAFDSFRGALDDIAKEMGDRRPGQDASLLQGIKIVVETDTRPAPALPGVVVNAMLELPEPGKIDRDDADAARDAIDAEYTEGDDGP